MADPLAPCRAGLAEDVRQFKEEVRAIAEAFFDTKERDLRPKYDGNTFLRALARPYAEFPPVTYRQAGAWRGFSMGEGLDNDMIKLPDLQTPEDGFGLTPDEDQKLGKLWRDFMDASRKRVKE